jgi:predicted MPP superfamily phosphohydrolase
MKLTRRQFLTGVAALTAVTTALDGVTFEHWWADWTQHTIAPHTVKTETTPLRIVQIADLHLRKLRWYHREMAKKVLHSKPDLLVFTGDQVDQRHRLPVLEQFLKLFPLDLPKVAILGNWEYFCQLEVPKQRRLYEKYNTRLLINESVELTLKGRSLLVTGLDEPLAGSPNLTQALKGHKPARNHLTLAHCPETIHQIAADLRLKQNQPHQTHLKTVLSGHTHGGQIRLFDRALHLPPGSAGFVNGWYDVSSLRMYVSRGIGTSIIPVRLGCRSEISVFDFLAA